MELQELRKEIDRIDDELLQLFCARMDVAARVAEYKKIRGLPILVPAREEEKLADVARKAGPEMADYAQSLYRTLFELSRSFQTQCNTEIHEKKYGLLGQHLGHSYSPQIHRYLGQYSYSLFEKEPEEMEKFLRNGDYSGINVTIPYKVTVIPYLTELSPVAQKLGSVNTIVRRTDGTLIGHNTDYYGFSYLLDHTGFSVSGKKVLVLGNGGASRTVVAVLEARGAVPVVISRSGKNNYGNLDLHHDATYIVNTTPVGMYDSSGIVHAQTFPHVDASAVDLTHFSHLEGVIDLIYNPARTKLLRDAEALGIPCANGLRMLVAQAKEASEWFTGQSIAETKVEEIHCRLWRQMCNIILIGMPGCGKSTIGKLLTEKTGKNFMDSDAIVEFLAEKSIPDIIRENGISAFRSMETDVLRTSASQSGKIISTGGGCVTESRNYPLLHQNGIIIWLKRELDKLPTQGRPLSQAGPLEEMYAVREPLYRTFADFCVDNNSSPSDTVAAILEILEDQV